MMSIREGYWGRVVILCCVIYLSGSKYCYGSFCNDINLASDVIRPTGSYVLNNGDGTSTNIYCQFYDSYGYAFVSNTTSAQLNVSLLMDDRSHVIIRHKRTDDKQYTSTIKQLDSFSHIPVSVQFNSHAGYTEPSNIELLPYIYVGFIPASDVNKGENNGWIVNNESLTFKNCDGNSNSYFTFLFNHANMDYTSDSSSSNTLMFSWYSQATSVSSEENIPGTFFTSYYEIHHGGCGGYGTSSGAPEVTGAAVGVKFLIKCDVPGDISHGNKAYIDTNIGSDVVYTCNVGYSLVVGNLTRTCASNGRWSGMSPVCKELVNVALGKQVQQTDTYEGGVAELAVDGGESQYWNDGSCTLTESKAGAFWEVDLGNLYIIDHVTLITRKDECCDHHLRDVELYMGTSKASYNLVLYKNGAINSSHTFHMNYTTHARWLKISRASSVDEQLSLCEVKVMGYRPDQLVYKERKYMTGTGNVLIMTLSVSRIDCCRKCFRYQGCIGVNYHLDTSLCHLLDSWSSVPNEDSNIVFFEAYYTIT